MSEQLSYLSANQVLTGIFGAGLVAHQIFKRYEPQRLRIQLTILLVPPLISSILLYGKLPLVGAVFASFALYLTTLVSSLIIYRLSPFHPLARYPGPTHLKISKLALTLLASRKGIQHKYIKSLHDRYGDVVRTGPNEISFCDPDALLTVSMLPKGPRWVSQVISFSNKPSLIAERNTHEHARKRKPWNRAFNSAALKGYEDIIAKRVSELADGLAKQKSEVDLGKWIGWFSYDFMSDMAFGGGSEMLRDGDAGSKWHMLEEGQAALHIIAQIPWLAYYIRRLPKAANGVRRMFAYGSGLAAERIKGGSLRRDLFYYLNNEDGVEAKSSDFAEIIANGTLAMIAGSDTTSIALSNIFYFVIKDPAVYKRLQAEVDHFFPPGESALETKNHPNMPYLNAVINETLRLVPIVPDGSQRQVPEGSGGRVAGSHYLPEGTVTFVHFYALHRDPKHFAPATEEFWPDRWLIAAEEQHGGAVSAGAPTRPQDFVHNAAAFVPFSFGPNNCVGKNLALQEMRMLVSHIMQRFDLRFADGWDAREYEDGLQDWFTIQKPALRVVLTPRQA
ncbi:high nitrogen upregulated cytochrome P450 monooxygenase 2 [Daedaleopsis nitida]|nr:high nitrogen upregulated cytochrome P450 monooxygenase 2 [Daedaleopsis nitida]